MNKILSVSSEEVTISTENGDIEKYKIEDCTFTPNVGDNVNLSIRNGKTTLNKSSTGNNESHNISQITVNDIKEAIYKKLGYREKLK